MSKRRAIISDANILIDYAKINVNVLRLATKYLFDIYVPMDILRQVNELTLTSAKALGLEIYEPTLEQIIEAADRGGSLTYEDKLCFVLARDNGWICATNDKRLRSHCSRNQIDCMWGFNIMLELNHANYILRRDASQTAQRIKDINPFIKQETVNEFRSKLR